LILGFIPRLCGNLHKEISVLENPVVQEMGVGAHRTS
jgi:hypothetical protein